MKLIERPPAPSVTASAHCRHFSSALFYCSYEVLLGGWWELFSPVTRFNHVTGMTSLPTWHSCMKPRPFRHRFIFYNGAASPQRLLSANIRRRLCSRDSSSWSTQVNCVPGTTGWYWARTPWWTRPLNCDWLQNNVEKMCSSPDVLNWNETKI